jgi:hypothetical protein
MMIAWTPDLTITLTHDMVPRNRGAWDCREAYPDDIIDHVEHPKVLPLSKLVRYEIW